MQESIPTLKELEKLHIIDTLKTTKGEVTKTAKLLGVSRAGLYRKCQTHEIKVETYRGTNVEAEG